MRHHDGIDFWIGGCVSQHMEADPPSRSLLGYGHPAPLWCFIHDARNMLRRGNDSQLLEGLAVNFDLARQPVERILGALDFVPMDTAVDDGNVNAASGVREAKFFDDKSIGLPL